MNSIYKVTYSGASGLQKNFIKELLKSMSADIIECVDEECCLIFYPKGASLIEQGLSSKTTLEGCDISVKACNKGDFSEPEIHDFFDNLTECQERLLSTLGLSKKDL